MTTTNATRRQRVTHHQCAFCGADIELPWDAAPVVMLKASGGRGTVRVLRVQGQALHHCANAPTAS
jgi:hypothetical protein